MERKGGKGDAHGAHARITASGRIGGACRARHCRPALPLRAVASRPVLPQAAVLAVFVQTRIAASSRIGLRLVGQFARNPNP